MVRLGQDTLWSNVGWRYSVVSTDASKEVLWLLQISGSWLDHRSQVRGGRKALRPTTGLGLIHTVSKSIPTLLPTWNIPGEILQDSYWFQLPLFIFSAKKSPGLCQFTNPLLPVTICLWISQINSHWAKTKYWMCKCCWHMYPIPLCLYYISKVCANAVCSLVKNAPLFCYLIFCYLIIFSWASITISIVCFFANWIDPPYHTEPH